MIALALENAGYDVRQCSNALQLKAELYSSPIVAADQALLVLNLELAKQCSAELSALDRSRASSRGARPQFLFICEFGGVRHFAPSGSVQLDVIGILEKPFDLDELEQLARTCREPNRQASGRSS